LTKGEAKSRINAVPTGAFDGLSDQEMKTIVAAGELRYVRRGDVIFTQGDFANRFMLIVTGRARYFYATPNGEKLLLMWLTPGESLGSSALYPNPGRYLASSEAVRDSNLLVWDRPTIRRLTIQIPRLLGNALTIASAYLDWYIATHVALTCQAAPQRLAHVLATLASSIGRKTEDGIVIDITNDELASAANITRFTASRLLASWNSRKLIRKSRGRILVSAPGRLWHERL
jgi:CRP/FNR family transcriptional regulator, nitrogen oxide reductase regulator